MARVNEGTYKDLFNDARKDRAFLPGIYYGKVIDNVDVNSTGRIRVKIDFLHRDPKQNRFVDARWLHAFAGSTNPADTSPEIDDYDKAMKTYGMWVQPPDIGNMVLIAFADGNPKNAFCLGAMLPDQYNMMIPGMPSGKTFEAESFNLPTVEKNKFSDDPSNEMNAKRPVHHPFAEAITIQGLINDPVRGIGTSGARRESPSDVFGILTKGVRDKSDQSKVIQAGHQFVMDDNPNSKNIRIRTGSGNQILLDDTNGIIYMINKGGKAWVELDMLGNINFFGEGSINFRAKGDFNLRADKNINIEAGNDLNFKAVGDNDAGGYKGLPGALTAIGVPPLGTGGNIKFDAAADMGLFANLNAQLTANGGDIDLSSGGRTSMTASGPLGINMNAPLGPIAAQSTLTTTFNALGGFGVTSGTPASIMAPMILLNSGGIPAIPPLPSVPAPRISGTPQRDQSSTPPKYRNDSSGFGIDSFELDTAKDGVILPEGGLRPKQGDDITTSVSVLITAEPYDGHAQFDQEQEDSSSYTEDTTADSQTGKDAIEPGDTPTADTPDGFKAQERKNVADAVGGAVNSVNDAVSSATGAVDSAIGSVQGAVDNAIDGAISSATDVVKGQLAGYQDLLPDQLSNFNFAALKNINGLGSVMNLAQDFGIAIPPIRFQTSNALSEKIIGITKTLKDAEARLNKFALDIANLPMDIQGAAVAEVEGQIKGAIDSAAAKVNGATTTGNTGGAPDGGT